MILPEEIIIEFSVESQMFVNTLLFYDCVGELSKSFKSSKKMEKSHSLEGSCFLEDDIRKFNNRIHKETSTVGTATYFMVC